MRPQKQRHVCLVVGTFLLAMAGAAFAAPPDPAYMAAKQTFMVEMRKKPVAPRVAAVTEFGKVANPDTVDVLLKRGITDNDAGVRQATRTALKQLADDRIVRQSMIDDLKKAFKKSSASDTVIELFRALIVSDNAEQQSEVMKVLEDYLSGPKANLLAPITVIDDFASQGDAEAFRAVKLLSTSKAFDQHFGFRRCVVQAMSQIRQPSAIEFLIELLPRTQGLVQHDVIQYLSRVTKQKFRDNDRDWAKWWKENQSGFEFPAANAIAKDDELDPQTPSYYGIPICAKRIVFVLDTSGSMRGLPIQAAKTALLKTIESLPEAVAFDVVMFDATSTVWLPRLVPATLEAKQMASQVIIERGLKLGTASNDALTTAFELEPEAIYFLSDGEPTDGAPPQIVTNISKLNKTRRISIHTIGVVTQRNGGVGLTMFMQPLSNQNWGKFQLVE